MDNEGARYALISGTSKCQEVSMLVARMWHEAAQNRWGLLFRRVESKANVADGPTRENLEILERLGAIWCEPMMPSWITNLWVPISVSCIG